MRHQYKGRKLGSSPAHTKAMKRSLTAALLYNDRIKTIESRAKEIRPEVDRIITWAKKGDLHSRRLAIARLGGDKELVREIFEKVDQGMFADRNGGYTRIMKLGPRKGDGAPMVIMELCTEPVKKKSSKATPKKATKAAPKKVEAPKNEDKAEDKAEVEETMLEELEPIEGSAIEETQEEIKEALEPKEDAEQEAEAKVEEEKTEKAEAKKAEEVREEQMEAEAEKAAEAAAEAAAKEMKSHE